MIKMEQLFIYHVRHKTSTELPGFGSCGFRWCYYQLGNKWAYYRDHPFGNRNKMLKKRFLSIIEELKSEPPLGSKGKSKLFNTLLNCKLKL